MVDRIPNISSQRSIVDNNGIPSRELRLWTKLITDRALILGEGSPEGVVEARQGAEYADINGTTGTIKYIKLQDFIEVPVGNPDYTLGWVLV